MFWKQNGPCRDTTGDTLTNAPDTLLSKMGRRARADCLATCLEKPLGWANRWIVSKHEETALTPPDETDESGAVEEDPGTEEEPLDRPPPDPEAPGTMAVEANTEL